MTKTRTITSITVYWDSQDPDNEGWAYRTTDSDGRTDSDGIGILPTATLGEAIEQACHELDVDLHADQFAGDPNADGGWASWDSEAD